MARGVRFIFLRGGVHGQTDAINRVPTLGDKSHQQSMESPFMAKGRGPIPLRPICINLRKQGGRKRDKTKKSSFGIIEKKSEKIAKGTHNDHSITSKHRFPGARLA